MERVKYIRNQDSGVLKAFWEILNTILRIGVTARLKSESAGVVAASHCALPRSFKFQGRANPIYQANNLNFEGSHQIRGPASSMSDALFLVHGISFPSVQESSPCTCDICPSNIGGLSFAIGSTKQNETSTTGSLFLAFPAI